MKYLEASVTISIKGIDIDICFGRNEEVSRGALYLACLCIMQNIGSLTHKHFQMVVKGYFSHVVKNIMMSPRWE